MPEDVRLWQIIEGDNLKEITKNKLDWEGRLENWIEKDIATISNDLLVIGRQVETDFGGYIDLLCLDRNSDVVIIELKRDRTPREVTAQTLDYASWVKDLPNEKITELANKYLGEEGPLEDAFKRKFGVELPEILNEEHRMLIVASEIDASSERIIKYLSDSYGIGINAATFQYFQNDDGSEFLSRVFLIEPSQMKSSSLSKRKPPLTYEDLQRIADSNGVGEIYDRLAVGLRSYFEQRGTTRSAITFSGTIGESTYALLHILPGESNPSQGVRFDLYSDRLSQYLGVGDNDVLDILPSGAERYEPWRGAPPMLAGFFRDIREVDQFLARLNEIKRK